MCVLFQWRIQDFPQVWAPTPKIQLFSKFQPPQAQPNMVRGVSVVSEPFPPGQQQVTTTTISKMKDTESKLPPPPFQYDFHTTLYPPPVNVQNYTVVNPAQTSEQQIG